jgi:hypothetical protein
LKEKHFIALYRKKNTERIQFMLTKETTSQLIYKNRKDKASKFQDLKFYHQKNKNETAYIYSWFRQLEKHQEFPFNPDELAAETINI